MTLLKIFVCLLMTLGAGRVGWVVVSLLWETHPVESFVVSLALLIATLNFWKAAFEVSA